MGDKATTRFVFWLILAALPLAFFSCASIPNETIEAATQAVNDVYHSTARPECADKVRSAESFLAEARKAYRDKQYEQAKTAAFQALRDAYDARECNSASKPENTENNADN